MWPGFDSRTRRHIWVEFVVGSLLCSEGFSPCSPVFLPPQKSTFLNSNSIGNSRDTGLSIEDCYVLPSLNKVNLFYLVLRSTVALNSYLGFSALCRKKLFVLSSFTYSLPIQQDCALPVDPLTRYRRARARPGRGHCVVFLGKALNSHSASLHPGV